MIEQWILNKIDPLKKNRLIILRDPQRMIQAGARVVDGWAEANHYTVLFCAGNLALRDMFEAMRDDADVRVLVVDRSRENAKIPLFYPDLAAITPSRQRLTLSLRDFLVEQTHDPNWPALVNDRNLSRLILANLSGTVRAYGYLRQLGGSRFSDTDLYKIVLGAVLNLNPFAKLSPTDIRRLCIEQHHALDDLSRVLPPDVMDTLRQTIASAPKPFNLLLERDPDQVMLAFTLAVLMRQHGLEYQILLSNLDPALNDFKEIAPADLDQALRDQLQVDPERITADVQAAEAFLRADPARLAFLLRDRLQLDQPQQAMTVLKQERLSSLIRGMALLSLLLDLIENRDAKFHQQVLDLLAKQAEDPAILALRQPGEVWQTLHRVYTRAVEVYGLTARLLKYSKKLEITSSEELEFTTFDKLWNQEGLNRLDYYTADLDRALRVGGLLPIPQKDFWPELEKRWHQARDVLKKTLDAVDAFQNKINDRFQDLYQLRYATWIQQTDSPVIFTHQFLPRMLRAYWDPQSGQKAVVMIFDGMRTDAWDELLRPVLEERYQIIESRPGSAILPTETQLSRKAISAGRLPVEFIDKESTMELNLLDVWLKQNMGLSLQFSRVKNDDTIESGMTVRYVSDKLDYIIFNFTDHNLHHNSQDLSFIYNNTVQTIIREDVRSVLRELPDDVLIFVTSDHGFTPVPKEPLSVPSDIIADKQDAKYRSVRATKRPTGNLEQRLVNFNAGDLAIPTTSEGNKALFFNHLLFPRAGYTIKRPGGPHKPDRYSHGGLSLAECMVPMVVLGPRQLEQPLLVIESMRQVGVVNEGQALTLELVIVPGQISLPDIPLHFAFSHEEILGRREIFTGQRTTYTFQWTPRLGDITPADRERGEITLPVTAILTYRHQQKSHRISRSTTVRLKLDPTRIRRRVDSKLDLLMGKVPKGLKS
jgi:hypothetical protein